MRRTCLIALAIGIAIAVVASARPRDPERPPDIDSTDPTPPIGLTTPFASASFQDTIYFGGTTWAADSARWEALRDSTWTFESGVGSWINTGQLPGKPVGYHGGMEGWSGFNPYWGLGRFERSPTCAISGAYSLWAGLDSPTAAARCYVAGQGYGNDWWISRTKTFFYPGSGNVTLSYDYRLETESGFDYTYVMIDTTGTGQDDNYLTGYSGQVNGHESLSLTRSDGTLPSTARNISIRFIVSSDDSDSDQDGLFTSACGHTAIDNIHLSGAINDFSDFESGDNGWVPGPESAPGSGDLSHLADITQLPPMQVPGPCSVTDSVLVFHGDDFRIPSGRNLAVSPWIDLKRNGALARPGKFVSFDMYSEYFWWPNGDNQFVSILARWRPSGPCYGFKSVYLHMFDLGKWCSSTQPVKVNLSGSIPAGAEQVQFAIGVLQYVGLFSQSTDTPWLDNIRFGVFGAPTSGTPEAHQPPQATLTGAEPNPLVSSTRIRFSISTGNHVSIDIYDVAGRLVRKLVDSHLPAGPNAAHWDRQDDFGQRVPAGLYFYRLSVGDFRAAGKLIVLR